MIIKIADLKKKIIYRSTYRGTKEMDKLLSSFVKKYIQKFDISELIHLLDLLDIDDENLFYSILNQAKQLDKYIVVNSYVPIKDFTFNLIDLKSRAKSFVNIGIELPTDDLLKVIISKYFSEKQIEISPKMSDFIIKNIERSYEKVFKCIKEIDELSLSSGKGININLIKKVLINE